MVQDTTTVDGIGPEVNTVTPPVLSAEEWADRIRFIASRVHSLRVAHATIKEQNTAALEAWRAEHADELALEAAFAASVRAEEDALRELGLEAFRALGDKHPGPGTDIREEKVLEYDPRAALEFARKHDVCLTLDVKAFEGLAIKGGALGVAKIHTVPKCTIAKDLGRVLGDG